MSEDLVPIAEWKVAKTVFSLRLAPLRLDVARLEDRCIARHVFPS